MMYTNALFGPPECVLPEVDLTMFKLLKNGPYLIDTTFEGSW